MHENWRKYIRAKPGLPAVGGYVLQNLWAFNRLLTDKHTERQLVVVFGALEPQDCLVSSVSQKEEQKWIPTSPPSHWPLRSVPSDSDDATRNELPGIGPSLIASREALWAGRLLKHKHIHPMTHPRGVNLFPEPHKYLHVAPLLFPDHLESSAIQQWMG